MTTNAVVINFNILNHSAAHLFTSGKTFTVDSFHLHGVKETFSTSIVVAEVCCMKFPSYKNNLFQYLLFCFFIYLMIGPFIESLPAAHIILDIILSATLILAVYAIHKKARLINGAIFLLVVTLSLMWIGSLGLIDLSDKVSRFLLCLYLIFLVYSFSKYIFSVKLVNSNLISAVLCLYLILGLLWGTMYSILEFMIPGSFKGDILAEGSTISNQLHYFYYFSYVTLTTLGYGDILPQTRQAAALCQTEAILGQFFTAVFVARLVGIQVAQQFSSNKGE